MAQFITDADQIRPGQTIRFTETDGEGQAEQFEAVVHAVEGTTAWISYPGHPQLGVEDVDVAHRLRTCWSDVEVVEPPRHVITDASEIVAGMTIEAHTHITGSTDRTVSVRYHVLDARHNTLRARVVGRPGIPPDLAERTVGDLAWYLEKIWARVEVVDFDAIEDHLAHLEARAEVAFKALDPAFKRFLRDQVAGRDDDASYAAYEQAAAAYRGARDQLHACRAWAVAEHSIHGGA